MCFERSSGSDRAVPGCFDGGDVDSGDDFCVHPDSLAYLNECEGHCRSDKDCFGDLKCHDTKGNGFVPGCSGDPGGRDYCINPASPGPDSHLKTFKLRLHWEKSYDSHSGDFCMDCSSCRDGSSTEVRRCGGDDFRFLNTHDEKTMVAVKGKDYCLEQGSSSIRLHDCDASNPCQWFSSGQGSFSGYLFELVTCKGKCVTQEHFPRSGEDLYGATCSTARRHYTNYWYKY